MGQSLRCLLLWLRLGLVLQLQGFLVGGKSGLSTGGRGLLLTCETQLYVFVYGAGLIPQWRIFHESFFRNFGQLLAANLLGMLLELRLLKRISCAYLFGCNSS